MRYLRYFLLLCLFTCPLHNSDAQDAVAFKAAALTITTQQQALHYAVELAVSAAQHERGLMYRKTLPDLHGMLFVFSTVQRPVFWMKNTPISLDMLFIDSHGVITQIVEKAKPQSPDLIPATFDTKAVLEIAGGASAHYHIAPGDRVGYSLFK